MSNALTSKDLRHFRHELRKILGQATGTLEQIEAESLAVGDGGLDTQGDEGVDQEFEEVDLDALDVEEKTARAAFEALERITNGTYGRCTECDTWIPRARLEVMPYTPHCVTCQEAEEEG